MVSNNQAQRRHNKKRCERWWRVVVVILLVVVLGGGDLRSSYGCDAFTITTNQPRQVHLWQQQRRGRGPLSIQNHDPSSLSSFRKPRASPSTLVALKSVASPSLLGSVKATLSAFSSSGGGKATTMVGIGASTSPLVYFLALLSAGIGLPVSEDILCIFCGTLLDKIQYSKSQLVVALFVGVVLSDMMTFSMGRLMKVGLLEPLRKRMKLIGDNNNDNQSTTTIAKPGRTPRKRDKILQKLEASGDWAGFVVRLSAGLRPGMMLLAGFSGKVTYFKYALGTAIGCCISLPIQLALGYSMSHLTSPAAIAARASKIFVVAPITALGVSSLLVRWNANNNSNNDK